MELTRRVFLAKRKLVDWDSIEPLYRAGTMSLNDICNQYEADHINSQVWKRTVTHVAIIKRAKAKKWTKNLAIKVSDRVKERLVTGKVTDRNQSEHEQIEQAADEPVRVGFGQRARTERLLKIQDELAEELRVATDIDIITRIRGFKDIAAAVKLHHDQQAAQYNLSNGDSKKDNLEEFLLGL
jgi:hypothetical protein